MGDKHEEIVVSKMPRSADAQSKGASRVRGAFCGPSIRWDQYVRGGNITLHYEAGKSWLLLYRSVLRRHYKNGDRTAYTVQYIENLTSATSFLGVTAAEIPIMEPPIALPVAPLDQPYLDAADAATR